MSLNPFDWFDIDGVPNASACTQANGGWLGGHCFSDAFILFGIPGLAILLVATFFAIVIAYEFIKPKKKSKARRKSG